MNAHSNLPAVLLVDDREDLLAELERDLQAALRSEAVVQRWVPRREDPVGGLKALEAMVHNSTRLVVTDHILDEGGQLGLGGPMVVNWCQSRLLPVGDFSRFSPKDQPPESTLFQWRLPSAQASEAAASIASMFRGFRDVELGLEGIDDLGRHTAPSALSHLLGRPHLEPSFSLFMNRLGSTNSHLLAHLRSRSHNNSPPTHDESVRVLAYLLGHVLGNSVLRFPGPLISSKVLAAYLGASEGEAPLLAQAFAEVKYMGPFREMGPFFWREDVDATLERHVPDTGLEAGEFDETRRKSVEHFLARKLEPHDCGRCDGRRGGFWCPLKRRPVCIRPDCSAPSDTWLPEGADLCRIERDFYEEWGPFLKL